MRGPPSRFRCPPYPGNNYAPHQLYREHGRSIGHIGSHYICSLPLWRSRQWPGHCGFPCPVPTFGRRFRKLLLDAGDTMKRLLPLILLVANPAFAEQLVITRLPGTYYGNGDEFNVTAPLNYTGGVAAINGTSFQTFCLESNETVSIGGTYDYVVNTGAVQGGVGGHTAPEFDPLSPLTAYMYAGFINGTLVGYDYGLGRTGSARALQDALWFSEGEVDVIGLGATFYTQALDANPTGIGGGRVLNLFQNGTHRQDQIFMQAPEPSTLALAGLAGIL